MEEKKIKIIINLTNDLHDSVDEIYESLMDNEKKEAIGNIEEFITKLRALKENLKNKDEV